VRDATACCRGCLRVGVNDGRSLSWVRAPVNPHLVLSRIVAGKYRNVAGVTATALPGNQRPE
jgi:hypothetical protein